jgi:Flp pilus assembly protein TadG
MLRGLRQHRRSSRLGTTAIETAFVLPVFLMLVLGIIEVSRAMLIQHVLNGACRKAARLGSTDGSTTATVKAKTVEILGSAVKPSAVTVFVKDATAFDGASPGTSAAALEGMPDIEVSTAKSRQMFMVRAKVKYSDIAIVKNIPILGYFLQNVTLDGQAFMRHE